MPDPTRVGPVDQKNRDIKCVLREELVLGKRQAVLKLVVRHGIRWIFRADQQGAVFIVKIKAGANIADPFSPPDIAKVLTRRLPPSTALTTRRCRGDTILMWRRRSRPGSAAGTPRRHYVSSPPGQHQAGKRRILSPFPAVLAPIHRGEPPARRHAENAAGARRVRADRARPPTEGRLVQGSLQLRIECDDHWRISLDQALLSKDSRACTRIATFRK